MTDDEIIRLAREAGDDWDHTLPPDREFLLRFGALVAAAAEAAEREACAKVAAEPHGWAMPSFNHQPSDRTIGRIEGEKEMSYRIAAAIRARGQA